MATLITIDGDTTKQFIAENVTSLQKSATMGGQYKLIVGLGAENFYFNFDTEVSRDTAFDGIVAAIGSIVNITP